jgi:hypothetical protein
MKTMLWVTAAVLVTAVPVNWLWQAKAGRDEIERENAAIDAGYVAGGMAYREAVMAMKREGEEAARRAEAQDRQAEMRRMEHEQLARSIARETVVAQEAKRRELELAARTAALHEELEIARESLRRAKEANRKSEPEPFRWPDEKPDE